MKISVRGVLLIPHLDCPLVDEYWYELHNPARFQGDGGRVFEMDSGYTGFDMAIREPILEIR